jgi:hypothetical protein
VEDSPPEENGSSRRVVLAEEGSLSPAEGEGQVREVQTLEEGELLPHEGSASRGDGQEVLEPGFGEEDLPEEAPQLGAAREVGMDIEEGPKLKKYRRVRVKKKAPQLEKEVQEMQSARRTRNERMACLRLLQQERRERQEAWEPQEKQELHESKEPQEYKEPEESKAEEPQEPQPRTPSPSSVDWKAAEEETKKQFAAAKAAGRRILTYEEWDKERKEKNEKWRQERKRKEWVEREVARRALLHSRDAAGAVCQPRSRRLSTS